MRQLIQHGGMLCLSAVLVMFAGVVSAQGNLPGFSPSAKCVRVVEEVQKCYFDTETGFEICFTERREMVGCMG